MGRTAPILLLAAALAGMPTLGVCAGPDAAEAPAAPQRAPSRPTPPVSEMAKAVEAFQAQTAALGLRSDSPRQAVRRKAVWQGWHGRVFWNLRNDLLDALPHEVRQRGGGKSLLRRNQGGFHLSGRPFHRQGTFLSVSYEGMRERIARSYLRTIPIAGERLGDFSATVDQAGNLLPVYDPASTRRNPDYDPSRAVSVDNLQYRRDPFAGNIIPARRMETVARAALDHYPLPNTDVGPFFRNNYFVLSPEENRANGMIVKLDHAFSARHRATVDTAFSNGFQGVADLFPTAADPASPDRAYESRRANVDHIFTASPQLVNTLGFDANSDVSEGGRDTQPFPYYELREYLDLGRPYPRSKTARNTYTWTDGLSFKRGKHSFRLVGQYTRYEVNVFNPQYPAGRFRFGTGLTSLPGIVNTGHSFASYLLGLAEYGERTIVPAPSYFRRTRALAGLRDQYEVRNGLSISVSLNVERSTPRTEKYDRQSTIDLRAPHPSGRPGALAPAGRFASGGAGPRSFQPDVVRAEPSIGLAWNVRSPKTVLRAGFGRSYSAYPVHSTQWAVQGFLAYPTFISPNVQLEPAVLLGGGFPPLGRPLPDLRPDAADDTVADLVDMSSRIPTYQSASLTIERQLPMAFLVTVGMVHSGGRNLYVGNGASAPNAIHLDNLVYRDRLNDEKFSRSLRPFPQFRGFDVYAGWPGGRYQRDAGFVRVDKRTSRGLSLNAYYEFSKQMDDYAAPYGKQDFHDRSKEWALTPHNEPHRLSASYQYELPMGPGKMFFGMPDWRRHLVDGWALSGSAYFQSGNPIVLHPQFNNTGGVVMGLNVNAVPGVGPKVSKPGPDGWFNPAAFDQPPDFTIGNVSRTHPSLRNPIYQNYDLSVSKRFPLKSDRTMELSAMGLNFLNHANWTDPDNVIGPRSAPNVNAGKIIGSRGGRIIQVGLRFSF